MNPINRYYHLNSIKIISINSIHFTLSSLYYYSLIFIIFISYIYYSKNHFIFFMLSLIHLYNSNPISHCINSHIPYLSTSISISQIIHRMHIILPSCSVMELYHAQMPESHPRLMVIYHDLLNLIYLHQYIQIYIHSHTSLNVVFCYW